MQLFAIVFTLPLLALGTPIAEPDAAAAAVQIEKRTVTCAITGSDVRYHVSPDANSGAPGQLGAKGSKVAISCYHDNTTGTGSKCPNNDCVWFKIASGKGAGYWITEYYFTYACQAQVASGTRC